MDGGLLTLKDHLYRNQHGWCWPRGLDSTTAVVPAESGAASAVCLHGWLQAV